jgi:hypothetical protein
VGYERYNLLSSNCVPTVRGLRQDEPTCEFLKFRLGRGKVKGRDQVDWCSFMAETSCGGNETRTEISTKILREMSSGLLSLLLAIGLIGDEADERRFCL